MAHLYHFLIFSLLGLLPQALAEIHPAEEQPLKKSAYFAFVDRDYIFTV